MSLLAVCGTLQSTPCTAAFLAYSLSSPCTTLMSSSFSSPTSLSSSSLPLPLASTSISAATSASSPSLPPPQVLNSNTYHNNNKNNNKNNNSNSNNYNTGCARYDSFAEKYVTGYSPHYISFMLQVVHSRVSVLQHQGIILSSFKTSDRNERSDGERDGGGDFAGEGDRIQKREEEKKKENEKDKEKEGEKKMEEESVMEKDGEMVMLQCADELWAAVLHILYAATPSSSPSPSSSSSSSSSPSPPSPPSSFTSSSIHLHNAAYFFGRIIISWNTFNIPIKIFETRTLDLLSGICKNPQSHGMLLLSALRVLILTWKKSPPVHCVCGHVSCHTVTDNPHTHGSAVVNTTGAKGSRHSAPLGTQARVGGEEGVRGRTGGEEGVRGRAGGESDCPLCQGCAMSVGTRTGTGTGAGADREWLKNVHSVKYSNNFLVTLI